MSKHTNYSMFSVRMIKAIVLIVCITIIQVISVYSAGFSFQTALLDSSLLLPMMFIFANLLSVTQRYYHAKSVMNIANMAMLVLFTFSTIILNYLFVTVFISDESYYTYTHTTMGYRILQTSLVYFLCLTFFWIEERKIREKRTQEFAIQKERETIQIELKSLQQQFKPHFLFNSLNSINALTIANPEEARRMVHLLSEFMRNAVKDNQSELISLAQEIHHIQLYTDIEKVRFGSRLYVEYDIPEEVEQLKVPSLILQPIIENAIKYGLYGHTDEVTIHITATIEDQYLVVSISNPFDPDTQSAVKGTGFGLESIEKKMLILYNQGHLLTIKISEKTYTTSLKIPQL